MRWMGMMRRFERLAEALILIVGFNAVMLLIALAKRCHLPKSTTDELMSDDTS